MDLKPAEISQILKKQLADYPLKTQVYEVGTVAMIADGIARVHGLSEVMAGELVEFSAGVRGMVMNLEEDNVGVAIFGEDTLVKEGDTVNSAVVKSIGVDDVELEVDGESVRLTTAQR